MVNAIGGNENPGFAGARARTTSTTSGAKVMDFGPETSAMGNFDQPHVNTRLRFHHPELSQFAQSVPSRENIQAQWKPCYGYRGYQGLSTHGQGSS